MMNFTEDDINEKALYVIKVNERGSFETGYVEINKSLLNEIDIDQFYSLFNEQEDESSINKIKLFEYKKKKFLDFYEQLYQNYPDVFGQRDYCSRNALRSANMNFVSIHHPAGIRMEVYPEWPRLGFFRPGGMSPSAAYDYKELKYYTQEFFNAYFIEQAYKRCYNDNKIVIHSNRKYGWTGMDYKLTDHISVFIYTNFAFGSASFFVITLIYDGIEIIPYSRLVLYRYAGRMDMLRHTREFTVRDSSWKLAFDFIKEATNEFLSNGSDCFITNYITNECEHLMRFLPQYLETNKFNLWEHRDGDVFYEKSRVEEVILNGFELTRFRGEKVSGALHFIQSLKKLNKLIPTQKYIDCIHECAVKVKPQLDKGIEDLTQLLSDLREEMASENENAAKVESKLLALKPKVEEYEKEKDQTRRWIVDTNRNEGNSYYSQFVKDVTEGEMAAKYEDYNNIMNEYNNYKEKLNNHKIKCQELDRAIDRHFDHHHQISKYLKAINEYLYK